MAAKRNEPNVSNESEMEQNVGGTGEVTQMTLNEINDLAASDAAIQGEATSEFAGQGANIEFDEAASLVTGPNHLLLPLESFTLEKYAAFEEATQEAVNDEYHQFITTMAGFDPDISFTEIFAFHGGLAEAFRRGAYDEFITLSVVQAHPSSPEALEVLQEAGYATQGYVQFTINLDWESGDTFSQID